MSEISDTYIQSDDAANHISIIANTEDITMTKSTPSSYLFHYPTPHPLPRSHQPRINITPPSNELILSSTTSVNELYNPENVFNFDECNIYSQHPTFLATAVEEPHPGFLQRDDSYVKEMVGELEEEKIDIIDEYMLLILHRIKQESKLSEVEYGRLLKRIECGEVTNVCNVLEESISRNDFTSVYQIIYPIQDELSSHQNGPIALINEEELPPRLSMETHHAAPVRITDIGFQHLPPVFIYEGMLCGLGLVKQKKQWVESFIVISTEAIIIYNNIQNWRVRDPANAYVSLCSVMSVTDKKMDHDVFFFKLEELYSRTNMRILKWIKHTTVLEIGSRSDTIVQFYRETLLRNLIISTTVLRNDRMMYDITYCIKKSVCCSITQIKQEPYDTSDKENITHRTMHLDIKDLIDSFALVKSQSFSWEFFKSVWISKGFNLLHDILKRMRKNRSETVPYVIYLKQCYNIVLNLFRYELNTYKAVGCIFCLYTMYSTQLGNDQEEQELESDPDQIPVVSIPIDVKSLDAIVLLVKNHIVFQADRMDVLQVVKILRNGNAFLPCYESLSFEETSKKNVPGSDIATFQSDLLHLQDFEVLETEYMSLTNRTAEQTMVSAIQELLRDLPAETESHVEVADTQPMSVSRSRILKVKKIQRRKILEEKNKSKRLKKS